MAKILTTVVGSYPLPDWLAAAPSEQALADAMRVVIHTQEQAGLDLVCDGELYRFDVNHPQTNGCASRSSDPPVSLSSRPAWPAPDPSR
jgi:5-methyltetrahydropteroyltriglutamate--homocysteine methyltransferase